MKAKYNIWCGSVFTVNGAVKLGVIKNLIKKYLKKIRTIKKNTNILE